MSYTFDDSGRPQKVVSTQSNRSDNKTEVKVFPTKAIPIIFIPGILGSPLRSLGEGYGTLLAYLEQSLRYLTYSADPYSQEIMNLGENVSLTFPINCFKRDLFYTYEYHC